MVTVTKTRMNGRANSNQSLVSQTLGHIYFTFENANKNVYKGAGPSKKLKGDWMNSLSFKTFTLQWIWLTNTGCGFAPFFSAGLVTSQLAG